MYSSHGYPVVALLLSGWFSLFGPDSYSNFSFQLWANPKLS